MNIIGYPLKPLYGVGNIKINRNGKDLEFNGTKMNLVKSTDRVRVYKWRHKKLWYKLLVPNPKGLTAAAIAHGIKHVISLFYGNEYEKVLYSNYYLLDDIWNI